MADGGFKDHSPASHPDSRSSIRHPQSAIRNRNMDIKRGIAVSPGVAIGPALVLDTEGFRIPQRFVQAAEVPDEIARLRKALADAAAQTRETEQAVASHLG